MINVIGLGYIGLPTALMFASHGKDVVGTDINSKLVSTLNSGNVTFKEDGLYELYQAALEKNIRFTTEYQHSDIYIVCVPTPYDKLTKKLDPIYVVTAVKNIIQTCKSFIATKNNDKKDAPIIIIESTVSPGCIDKYIRPVLEENGIQAGIDIHIAHAPERIIPGNMIHELKNNSRTIGADCLKTGEKVKALYKSFCDGEIVVTDIKTAEMTKVIENTYRDINIAFANELAKICREGDMDVYEIIRIANKHPRVNVLQPGPGVGGHCISVDPWFLAGDYPGLANIILTARKINDSMPEFVLGRINDIIKAEGISDVSRVGLYGLSYKENVDDIRESPTLQLLENMEKHLAPPLAVYDPYITYDVPAVKRLYHDFDQFINDVDMVVIMVAHNQILENSDKLKDKIVFDTKNALLRKDTYKL